jgi:hypothetical protein
MTYQREDYNNLVAERKKKELNGHKPHLEYLAQAEVKMENLTGNPYWDIYLSYLQEALERMSSRHSQLEAELCSPDTVDPNVIMGIKLAIAQIGGQIDAVEQAIALPKSIMEMGDRAKEKLTLGR